jgi:hypothetical protein
VLVPLHPKEYGSSASWGSGMTINWFTILKDRLLVRKVIIQSPVSVRSSFTLKVVSIMCWVELLMRGEKRREWPSGIHLSSQNWYIDYFLTTKLSDFELVSNTPAKTFHKGEWYDCAPIESRRSWSLPYLLWRTSHHRSLGLFIMFHDIFIRKVSFILMRTLYTQPSIKASNILPN